MKEIEILKSPNIIVSYDKERKQDKEYSIAVIGPSMTGKSRFIARFINDTKTASVLYEDNDLGKTKVNTRYIFDKKIDTVKAIIVLDLDDITRGYTNQHRKFTTQELNEYVEKRYNEISNILTKSIQEEYMNKPQEQSDSEFICRYFDKFSNRTDLSINLNEIFEIDLWIEPVKILKTYLEDKDIDTLSLVDTRGVFDSMEVCNRKMPSYVDANILFFKPLTNTNTLIHKVADDLKLFLSNPTELCLRFSSGGSIYPNNINDDLEDQIYKLCVDKTNSQNKDVKYLRLYEDIFIDDGILPEKNRQDNRLFTHLLFNKFGTLIPDILEINQMEFISDEEKELKSSASKRIFDRVAFHVVDKLIMISISEKEAVEHIKKNLQSMQTIPLAETVTRKAIDVAIDKMCIAQNRRTVYPYSAEKEPYSNVLKENMKSYLINPMEKNIVPQISNCKDNCEWLPLQDHVYHYVSVYAYKIIEDITKENLFSTDEDENFLLTRMFDQMVIKETPSYINYVSSIVAKRCSIVAFNYAIKKLFSENEQFSNGEWSYNVITKRIDESIWDTEKQEYNGASWLFCLVKYTTLYEIKNTLSVQVDKYGDEIKNKH